MKFIQCTEFGLEDIAKKEFSGEVFCPGRIIVEKELKEARLARTATKILMPVITGEFEGLENVYERIKEEELSFSPESFKIEPEVKDAEVKKIELAKTAGQALVDKYGWKVNLNSPALSFAAEVIDDKFIFGVNMTKNLRMEKRAYDTEGKSAVLAACMILLTEGAICDPNAREGTVLIEGAALGRNALGLGFNETCKKNILKTGFENRIRLARTKDVPFEFDFYVSFSDNLPEDKPAVCLNRDGKVMAQTKYGKITLRK